jgi:ketosteroid isomerase-like protein
MRLLLITLALGASLLPAQNNAKQAAAEKEILELEKQYNGAYAANDLPRYFSFLAEDFNQWLPSGRTDKASYQKSWTRFIEGGGKVLKAEFSNMVIQISPEGDSAIASYLLNVGTHSARGDSDEFYQESDVFFKRNGEWKIVHLNYAPARKKPAQP